MVFQDLFFVTSVILTETFQLLAGTKLGKKVTGSGTYSLYLTGVK
jgi:hypothetical protein